MEDSYQACNAAGGSFKISLPILRFDMLTWHEQAAVVTQYVRVSYIEASGMKISLKNSEESSRRSSLH